MMKGLRLKASFLLRIFILLLILTPSIRADEKPVPNTVYKGPIYNVFFHPLIAYPKLAFNSTNKQIKYIDNWFVTTQEFNKIILELYEKGFVLFSPKDIFKEIQDKQGKVIIVRKTILLPPGKKPLILSLDDYNFYRNMKLHGTVHRFWVDKDNKLATITNTNNRVIVRYDQEVPQLLENFIALHPDFSFNKARGLFSLTGYNGIFGYDTHQPSSPNYQSQVSDAKEVIHKLKEMGWEFGSHSYFHLNLNQQSTQAFEKSERRWRNEVGSLVGFTSYYFFPFGDAWEKNAPRMNFLRSLGYKYFFGVSNIQETYIKPGIVIMGRFPLDGLAVRNRYKYVQIFISPSKIIDINRINQVKR